ncbi:MAG: hypothetical protein KDB51_14920 [Propionibacteriaceae bacterium]|nr:hypothetical protein [Propionibacteriaceae bacterium]
MSNTRPDPTLRELAARVTRLEAIVDPCREPDDDPIPPVRLVLTGPEAPRCTHGIPIRAGVSWCADCPEDLS